VFAELIDIVPASRSAEPLKPESVLRRSSIVLMSGIQSAHHPEGFHDLEEGRWRWTQRRFSLTMESPGGAQTPRLELAFYIPPTSMERLGSMELSARVNQCSLPPSRYSAQGSFTYSQAVPATCLKPDGNRVEFSLDKALTPAQADGRELGLFVEKVALGAE
jgi:hypothetical protein